MTAKIERHSTRVVLVRTYACLYELPMSLVMPQASAISSPGLRRKRSSEQTKPVGSSISAYNYRSSTSTTPKQRETFARRPLPNGPGPLPDMPKMHTCKYVTNSSLKEPRSYDLLYSGRTTLRESGQVSEGRGSNLRHENFTASTRNKSKSLSSLDLRSDSTGKLESSKSSSRTRTEASASEKMGSLNNQLSTDYLVNPKLRHNNSPTSVYRSTTHLHYKDYWEDKTSQSRVQSYASEKNLSLIKNSSTAKARYNAADSEKAHKVTLTALPGSDLKCARKSSLSSSNSSPSVSKQ